MSEFEEAKRKRERGVSNSEFWEEAKEDVEKADQALVVTVKDGVSSFNHTGGGSLEVVGALEHAKFVLIHNSIHWED
ncbi:hypothetical protein [Alkalibacterium thalassium]|uniref:Uncharacterized protein n=1 Tax=Alkalibacterium thalassium TaxID=426701 RepID=A0A1G8VQD4_9LACT|nr:hypothetical protein [Alkalibacterium thalassium]SDJ68159.1 hypothetical protein SAMN04488098_100259 [Alkalibacterium thalassium]